MRQTEKYKKACIVAGCRPGDRNSHKVLYAWLEERGWIWESGVWYKPIASSSVPDDYLTVKLVGDFEAVDRTAMSVTRALERERGMIAYKVRTESVGPNRIELTLRYEWPLPF